MVREYLIVGWPFEVLFVSARTIHPGYVWNGERNIEILCKNGFIFLWSILYINLLLYLLGNFLAYNPSGFLTLCTSDMYVLENNEHICWNKKK